MPAAAEAELVCQLPASVSMRPIAKNSFSGCPNTTKIEMSPRYKCREKCYLGACIMYSVPCRFTCDSVCCVDIRALTDAGSLTSLALVPACLGN